MVAPDERGNGAVNIKKRTICKTNTKKEHIQ